MGQYSFETLTPTLPQIFIWDTDPQDKISVTFLFLLMHALVSSQILQVPVQTGYSRLCPLSEPWSIGILNWKVPKGKREKTADNKLWLIRVLSQGRRWSSYNSQGICYCGGKVWGKRKHSALTETRASKMWILKRIQWLEKRWFFIENRGNNRSLLEFFWRAPSEKELTKYFNSPKPLLLSIYCVWLKIHAEERASEGQAGF